MARHVKEVKKPVVYRVAPDKRMENWRILRERKVFPKEKP